MASVYKIADAYVETLAAADPIAATYMGVPGYDHLMNDYSLESADALAEAQRKALGEMRRAGPGTERERICRDTFIEEISISLDQHDAGEHFRGLNILHSPVQSVRQIFDLMPLETEEHWSNVASRMERLPQSLASYRVTLENGARRGLVASQRQANGVAAQIDTWTGADGQTPFFTRLVDQFDASKHGGAALGDRLQRAVAPVSESLDAFGKFLQGDYMQTADPKDGVGADRYALSAKGYNGVELDLDETYRWGWEQLRWVQSEMAKTAGQIKPGASVAEAVDLLETDPARAVEGEEPFRQWMQDLKDRTISELDRVHFDLDDRVRRIETLIAPPGGSLAMYYTGPSEDFSRPGRTWYPTGGKTVFPVWREVSIAYHEGVPGHHFQIATTRTLADELSRYQRLLAGTSGYVEGWALYAERLMGELGYLENPDYYMGMLDAQALRSVRVIVDIGMHLGLRVPDDSGYHPGEVWNPDMALEFMRERVHFPTDFVTSEIDRYLGIPGQAISYKVGERVWLEARKDAKQRAGPAFDLKEWHNRALRLGPMGLAQMKREMTAASHDLPGGSRPPSG